MKTPLITIEADISASEIILKPFDYEIANFFVKIVKLVLNNCKPLKRWHKNTCVPFTEPPNNFPDQEIFLSDFYTELKDHKTIYEKTKILNETLADSIGVLQKKFLKWIKIKGS